MYPPTIYNGTSVEVVESFKFLGAELYRIQSLAIASLPRFETGERSQFALSSRCSELNIDNPALRMQWCNPLYCMKLSSIWGVRDVSKGVPAGDQLHRDFLRCVMGVHRGTPYNNRGVT